jgi:hypothetical protein
MKHRIICTGNPDKSYTLAHTVRRYFPDTKFIHKSNGYDFLTEHGLNLFQDEITNYNVFLNCSYIDIGIQESLLNITKNNWKCGHVFNIGSIAEYGDASNYADPAYINSKISLKKTSLTFGYYDFKTTYMILGGFRNVELDSDPRMEPHRIVEIIKWILNTDEFIVPIIGVVGPTTHNKL